MTNGFLRSILLASTVVLLMTVVGCPSSGEKSGVTKPQHRASEPSPPGESIAANPPPAAEFQHPAALPPSEPLPKPTTEPTERPPAPPAESARTMPSATTAASHDAPAAKTKEPGQPPPGRPNIAKNSGVPFDPIAENGPIFVIKENGRDVPWPKPKLAMIITGMEQGYIEPCGCAGLDRMKGGMSRRHTLFNSFARRSRQSWIEKKDESHPARPVREAGRWSGSTWADSSTASAGKRS